MVKLKDILEPLKNPFIRDKEICFECGESVKFGSGNFVNRVPSLNNYATRKANGAAYPEGGFICARCDEKEA